VSVESRAWRGERRFAVSISGRVAVVAIAASALFLSACTTFPPRTPETVVAGADRPFMIDGRLSAKRGADGASANFAWNHEAGRDRIDLASPFGQLLARVDGSRERVVVERPGGATETYPDWSAMTVALLGAPVPIDDLAYWIRGAAREGGTASVERDAVGRALVLRQQAWEIVYSYPDDAPGAMPSRVVLKRPDAEPVEVRVVVDRWGEAQVGR
jgi:outer membrane lipoprotein LolB